MQGIRVLTDRGVSTTRPHNEDAFAGLSVDVKNEVVQIAVVCDGLGGMGSGSVASNYIITNLVNYIVEISEQVTTYEELERLLTEKVVALNYDLYSINKQDGTTMGTTIVMALIRKTGAYILHSGDSRAYKVQPETGKVLKLTVDHSYVEYQYARGEIDQLPPDDASERSKLVACMGVEDTLVYESRTVKLAEGDSILLATDGYWGHAASEDMLQVTAGVKTLQDSFIEVMQRGSTDNITVMIVEGL